MALFKLKPIGTIDFARLARPVSPNTYLICPPGFSASAPDQEAPIFPHSRDRLISAWIDLIRNQARVVEIDKSDDGFQRTYVQRTRLAGFPDIITVQFIALSSEACTLAVYSRSQYGRSDFGANRKRVAAWLTDLEKRLG